MLLRWKCETQVNSSKPSASTMVISKLHAFVLNVAGFCESIIIRHTCGYFMTSWWRHDVETFSATLVVCEGNPLFTGGFPSERARNLFSLKVSFGVSLNKLMNKQPNKWWFWTLGNSCGVNGIKVGIPHTRSGMGVMHIRLYRLSFYLSIAIKLPICLLTEIPLFALLQISTFKLNLLS